MFSELIYMLKTQLQQNHGSFNKNQPKNIILKFQTCKLLSMLLLTESISRKFFWDRLPTTRGSTSQKQLTLRLQTSKIKKQKNQFYDKTGHSGHSFKDRKTRIPNFLPLK